MNQRTRKAIRTFLQACPAAAIVAVLHAFGLVSPEQGTALMVPLTAAWSFVYNLAEDQGVWVPVKRE